MDNKEVRTVGHYVYQVIIGISVIFSTLVYFLKDNNASKDKENVYLKGQIEKKDSLIGQKDNKAMLYIMLRTQLETKQTLTKLDSLIINN
jgi:hypothetical protein